MKTLLLSLFSLRGSIEFFSSLARSRWVAASVVIVIALISGHAKAIDIDFDTAHGYTANTLLEGQPSTGTKWVRSANTGTSDAACKIVPNTSVDRQQGATFQVGTTTTPAATYNFTPSTADLGQAFTTNSTVDYEFLMRLEKDPNPYTGTSQQFQIGHAGAAEFKLLCNGQVQAEVGNNSGGGTFIPLRTTMGGTTSFTALGGVYLIVSGQVNYAKHTYTVFLNGIAQTVGGPTDTMNFPFVNLSSNSPEVSILNYAANNPNWIATSMSHIRLEIVNWSAPITISTPGTYIGSNWLATGTNQAAVTITTPGPVVLLNCRMKSCWNDITTYLHTNVDLTVGNCKGYGTDNPKTNAPTACFIYGWGVRNLIATNNYMESTQGILVTDNAGGVTQSVNVQGNYAFNIDGRVSDGNGGYQTNAAQFNVANFCKLSELTNAISGEIAWNKIVEVPNASRVEDTIGNYQSRGSPANPILVHDNYIQGGYTFPLNSSTYSAGGINCGDSNTDDATTNTPCYFIAYDNVVVNYSHCGLGGAHAGHNISLTNNFAYSCGFVGADTPITANTYSDGTEMYPEYGTYGNFVNNVDLANQIGWYNPHRNTPYTNSYDYNFSYTNSAGMVYNYAAGASGNTWYNGTVTQAVEQAAVDWWYQDAQTNNIPIGPNW